MTSPPGQGFKRDTDDLVHREALYRYALMAGRLVYWETDLAAGIRIWRDEAMKLFGLKLENGIGRFGGDDDEFKRAVHPDDRHIVANFYALADKQDWFPAEYRIVRPDGAVRWLSGGGQVVARSPDGKALRLVNVVADITERKNAEEHVHHLLRELTHRGKNLLAVVQAIASQTGRTTDTIQDFQERFTQRLQGLSATHDLLVAQNWKGAALGDLVRDQVTTIVSADLASVSASGPDVYLNPHATETIGLALHELATNAVKHGALSSPSGRVAVVWSLEPQPDTAPERLHLHWNESGGPAVLPPSREGFGHVVFERIVARALDGEVTADFDPAGLKWHLSIPTTNPAGHRTVFKDRVEWQNAD